MSLIGPRPDAAGAGRAVHRAPARAPGDQARASPAGRRSTAAPRCRGASGSSSTSTTSSTARWRSTCGSCGARVAMVLGGSGLYKGADRRLGGGAVSPPAVLLTGVGKRYDIVSCFAAADDDGRRPTPPRWRPRSTRRTCASTVPLIDDPGYVPALARAVRASTAWARCCRSPTSTSRCSRAPASEGALPALVPSAEVARATYDKYEAHLLLERLALPSPPTVLPEDGPRRARLPGDGQAAPRLGRALDPPRPRRRAGALLHRLRARADDGAARDGRPGAVDRLPRRPRRPLPERDPAHDARVARRRVDQGRR